MDRAHRRRDAARPSHVRQRLSGARLGHAQRAGRRRSARRSPTRPAASSSTPISAPTCPALYAAGDVVLGLDQISHAMGEGGVAATTIRNDLAKQRAAACAADAQAEERPGSATIRPSDQIGDARRGTGSARVLPSGRSISSRSPAPKFSTATTVPSGAPAAIDAGEADQIGMIIFALVERRQRRRAAR